MRFSFAILFWLFSACVAQAREFDYSAFSHVPIQHEGRIKPLETFALIHLEKFHGSSHINGMPAIAWLAQAMFDPAKAIQQPLFLVKDADAQSMLNLVATPDNLYSFAEATQIMAANEKLIRSLSERPTSELSSGQRAVLELYENTQLFEQITLSCTLFLPLNIDLPIEKPGATFIDYFKHLPDLQKTLKNIVRHKGTDIDSYNPTELHLAQAMDKLSLTMASSENNSLLRVIPPQWNQDDSNRDEWLSPWMVFHSGKGSPQTAILMQAWRQLADAYQQHNIANWQQAMSLMQKQTLFTPGVRPLALSLEVIYYHLNPLGFSIGFYAAGFILSLLCLCGMKLRYAALPVTLVAASLHFLSILTRVTILQRPPVGTLYESLLFVSLIAVLFGLYLEYRQRNYLGLLVATLTGSLLLLASQSFSDDDTMGMLIAVLNTNFWLATHVLCITSGYGFGLVAGILAHIYLIMRCIGRDADKAKQVLRGTYGTALIALLFTSLGTILGGIWADQSWGRFWGWDPKENGALLICLWLIWVLHGRISRRMGERGFAVGLALLNVVIALSWLGVNLLATGLHSYGFTDKAAWSLGIFCASEFSFAAITYLLIWRRDRGQAY